MKLRLLPALIFVPFVPLACGDEDAPPETREEFCNRWAVAACSDEVVSACQAASTDACRLGQEGFCLELVPSGTFVPDQADACIGAVASAYSDADLAAEELNAVLRLGPPCDRLVRGPRAAAETCTSRRDCDAPAGYDCVFTVGAVMGTCQIPVSVEAGRDCSADNAVCPDGFFCDGENCVEGAELGQECARSDECREGYCSAADACAATLATGADCTIDEQCASGICYTFSSSEQVCTDRVRLSRTDPLCENLR